jgi:HEAT repeat protein
MTLRVVATVFVVVWLVPSLIGGHELIQDADLIEMVKADLQSPNPQVKGEALFPVVLEVHKLARLSGTDQSAAQMEIRALVQQLKPELLKGAYDDNIGVRSATALLLQFVESDSAVLAALVHLAREDDRNVRRPALGSLRAVGENFPDARTLVIEWLAKPGDPQQFEEGAYLAREWRMKEAVPALIEGLRACDLGTQQRAALALGAIGRDAAAAVPSLKQARSQLNLASGAVDAALKQIVDSSPDTSTTPATKTPPIPPPGRDLSAAPTDAD